jgi:hypothetical protein
MHGYHLRYAAAVPLMMVLASCGDTGPQGPQGPPGPPADRSKLYCRNSGAVLNASTSNLTTSITCDAKTDIPWEGSCEAPDLPTGLYLARSEPLNWSDLNQLPGWTCTWAAFGAPPNLDFGGNAIICCFAMGQTP